MGRELICSICGITGVPLDRDHIIPKSLGGSSRPDNLRYVCRNCHMMLHTRSDFHFERFLRALVERSPKFGSAAFETKLGHSNFRPDIVVNQIDTGETLIIECKNYPVLNGPRFSGALEQIRKYLGIAGKGRGVLAFPGYADDETLARITGEQISLWDLKTIGALFKDEIEQINDPVFSNMFLGSEARRSLEDELISQLRECPSGNEGWQQYQKLIGRILNHLFCPPLTASLNELSDASCTNRRDFIYPNYASDGFWLFLRTRYAADYIVVDAKNGKGKVKKAHILQVSNYLKEHGVGRYGMILCREGSDKGASVTLREQWLLHHKLIVVLTHREIEEMLLAKAALGDPSATIGMYIQRFRLSM